MNVHDDIIATMLRWSENFVERPHAVVGNLPLCPFAKAARLNRTIQWEVRPFASNDPLNDNSELLTLVRDFSQDSTFETLFVIHPEPATVSSPELDALVARLNTRLMAHPELSDLRAFDAHPNSFFQIGGLHTRRAPYPSFQILSHRVLTSTSNGGVPLYVENGGTTSGSPRSHSHQCDQPCTRTHGSLVRNRKIGLDRELESSRADMCCELLGDFAYQFPSSTWRHAREVSSQW